MNILNVYPPMDLRLFGLMDRIYVRMIYIIWENLCHKAKFREGDSLFGR